jgi:hypothetical protein
MPCHFVFCRQLLYTALMWLRLLVLSAAVAAAQVTPPILNLTATTENVSGAKDSIRIDVLRWSTDAEREQLTSAWNLKTSPDAEGRAGRGGQGAARGGRGAAAGRGGRGGRGGDAAPEPPPTPESSLAAALDKAPTVGHLWSSEVAGYSVREALRLPQPDGGERIILITERRLGAWNDLWKPVGGAPTNYPFSVIELRLNAKGEGEGKASLTGKVSMDAAAKSLALENYAALPVIFKNVKRAK